MHSTVMSLAVGTFTLIVAAAGGFWVSNGTSQRDQKLTQELLRQGRQLTIVNEQLAELAQRSQTSRATASEVTSERHSTLQPEVEAAVDQALQRQAKQVSADRQEQLQPTVENLEAHARGETLVGKALSARRWDDKDAAAFRAAQSDMTGDQAHELRKRISVAINEGKLAVETVGLPF